MYRHGILRLKCALLDMHWPPPESSYAFEKSSDCQISCYLTCRMQSDCYLFVTSNNMLSTVGTHKIMLRDR